jgi:hypothetical protein
MLSCFRASSVSSVQTTLRGLRSEALRDTHSPTAVRPGRISDDLREGFEQAGYPLSPTAIATPGLIEVYPHPALVELSGTARVPQCTYSRNPFVVAAYQMS